MTDDLTALSGRFGLGPDKQAIVVHVCATLLELSSVNSKDQSWSGDLRFELAFAAPSAVVAEIPSGEFDAVAPTSITAQKLFWPTVSNAGKLSQCEVWLSSGAAVPPGLAAAVLASAGDPCGEKLTALSMNLRIRGVFNQRFASLADFPLDTELLQVRLAIEQGFARFATRAESAGVFPAGHTVLVEAATCSTLDEWRLGSTFGSVTSKSAARRSRTGQRYSQWTGLLLVQRKAGHYLIGFAAPFLLQSLGMVLLFMDGNFAHRISAGTTLIMTSRGLMERMQEALPQRDGFNLTLLERHFTANLGLMLLGMAMAACSAYAPSAGVAAVVGLARFVVAAAAAAPQTLDSCESGISAAADVATASCMPQAAAAGSIFHAAMGFALRPMPGIVSAAAALTSAANAQGSAIAETADFVPLHASDASALAASMDSFLAWLCFLLWLVINVGFAASALRLALLGRPLRWGREPSVCCGFRRLSDSLRRAGCCRCTRRFCRAVFPSATGGSACGRQHGFVNDDAGPEEEGRTFLEDLPHMFAGVDQAEAARVAAAAAWLRIPSSSAAVARLRKLPPARRPDMQLIAATPTNADAGTVTVAAPAAFSSSHRPAAVGRETAAQLKSTVSAAADTTEVAVPAPQTRRRGRKASTGPRHDAGDVRS